MNTVIVLYVLLVIFALLLILYTCLGRKRNKWTPREYAVRLQKFELDKRYDQSYKRAVRAKHPDFDRRSPNYIDVKVIAKGDFWRELNIDYYKAFPELADAHGWDMERMQYKNRKDKEK